MCTTGGEDLEERDLVNRTALMVTLGTGLASSVQGNSYNSSGVHSYLVGSSLCIR